MSESDGARSPERGTQPRVQRSAVRRSSDALHRAVFEGPWVGALQLGADRKIVKANPAACSMLGWSAEELVGRSIPTDPEEALSAAHFDRLLEGQARYLEVQTPILCEDGSTIFGIIRCEALTPRRGWAPTVVALIADRTAELRVDDDAAELVDEARLLVEDADALKSSFLGAVSHELRTPLTIILGFIDLLLQGDAEPLTALQTEYAEHVRSNARVLHRLVLDLLDLSPSGRLREADLQFDEVDVATLVADTVSGFAKEARAKGLDLVLNAPDHLVASVDSRLVSSTLGHLLSNALKFTSVGRVEVNLTSERGIVSVEVDDTGSGVPAGAEHIMFEQFRQADEGTARRYGGLGAGLAIATQLVEMVEGQLGFVRKVEGGTIFWFRFPVSPGNTLAIDPELEVGRHNHQV